VSERSQKYKTANQKKHCEKAKHHGRGWWHLVRRWISEKIKSDIVTQLSWSFINLL